MKKECVYIYFFFTKIKTCIVFSKEARFEAEWTGKDAIIICMHTLLTVTMQIW